MNCSSSRLITAVYSMMSTCIRSAGFYFFYCILCFCTFVTIIISPFEVMLCIILLLVAKFYVLFFIWWCLSTVNKRLTDLLTYLLIKGKRVVICKIDGKAARRGLRDTAKVNVVGPILWGHSGPLCHALSLSCSVRQ